MAASPSEAAREGGIVKQWFDLTASQLSYDGLLQLHEVVPGAKRGKAFQVSVDRGLLSLTLVLFVSASSTFCSESSLRCSRMDGLLQGIPGVVDFR